MPQVTVYVREEDLPIWKAIGKKAEFIHNALAQADTYKTLPAPQREAVKTHIAKLPEVIKTKQDVEKTAAPIKKPPVTYTPKTNWGA